MAVRSPLRTALSRLRVMSRAIGRDKEWARAGYRAPDALRWLYDDDPEAALRPGSSAGDLVVPQKVRAA